MRILRIAATATIGGRQAEVVTTVTRSIPAVAAIAGLNEAQDVA